MVNVGQNKQYTWQEIKVVIGLGNPGATYALTRHNIGFRILDTLAEQNNLAWVERDLMLYADGVVHCGKEYQVHNSVLLIKPQTYMNHTGKIIPFLKKKGISSHQILVVHDELEKKFGTIALRFSGSPRGHNGVRSIISFLGYNFWRLRFGISRPPDKKDVNRYVLNAFLPEEENAMKININKALTMMMA